MDVLFAATMAISLILLEWFLNKSYRKSISRAKENLKNIIEEYDIPHQMNFNLVNINKGDQVYEGIYEYKGCNYKIELSIPQFHYLIEKEDGRIREFPHHLNLSKDTALGKILHKITDSKGNILSIGIPY